MLRAMAAVLTLIAVAAAPALAQDAQEWNLKGVEAYKAGKWDEAIQAFEAARRAFATFLVDNPGHELADSAQYWLGQCAVAQGDYSTALLEYRRVVDSFPFGDKVADALPPTFQFCIDEVADAGDTCGVQWHVENDGKPLPFTRGCSMYKTDASGLIVSGFDVPEPAPLKPGSAGLLLLGLASKIIKEPVRAVPLVAWALYCFILFFSNGILPGPDATQLDPATWVEVRWTIVTSAPCS